MSTAFDLIGIPRRHFFAILGLFSKNKIEKERLMEFCASDGTDDRWENFQNIFVHYKQNEPDKRIVCENLNRIMQIDLDGHWPKV